MKTIAVVSQKGGVGKTTMALHLAVAAHRAGYRSAILDLDPQASAEAWGQWRQDAPPEVVSAKPAMLSRALAKVEQLGVELLVLDTAAGAEGSLVAAADVADLIVLPCPPRILDLHALQRTVSVVRLLTKSLWLVFNRTRGHGEVREAARDIVGALGVEVAPVRFTERSDFHRSIDVGQSAQEFNPGGKAAEEAQALWEWVCGRLGLSAVRRVNRRTRGAAA